jgi:hypothetical protein
VNPRANLSALEKRKIFAAAAENCVSVMSVHSKWKLLHITEVFRP